MYGYVSAVIETCILSLGLAWDLPPQQDAKSFEQTFDSPMAADVKGRSATRRGRIEGQQLKAGSLRDKTSTLVGRWVRDGG